MSHVVEATYENGVLKLAKPLPFKDQEKVRVTVESVIAQGHNVMDIEPISLVHRMFSRQFSQENQTNVPAAINKHEDINDTSILVFLSKR